ncbi:lipoprotein insertase outer membrane protein LolB [Nitrosomonas supralitoralis]|uniref:lipoprotein insertase outer membrane protein LolB n=1 Tax=Nitrosomonas supralitoralis TaxID=2116706 RepID=UPI001F5B5516|nr:lipoprotein insertase outer membrane protein LolB [Nitrosomonas supralitoralis]
MKSINLGIEFRDSKLPVNGIKAHQMNVILGFLIGCIILLSSGCRTLPSQPPSDAVATTIFTEPLLASAQTIPANDFNILGRISIQDKNQSFSGSFRWQHMAASDEILLFTPLGQAVAEITKDLEGVRLITSKLEAFYAPDAESLTEEILGWRLPLNGLQYWIQGTHLPLTAAEKDLDRKDQIINIRQDGWHIHYASFTSSQLNSLALPRIINLFYDNLRIRLVIDNWKVE